MSHVTLLLGASLRRLYPEAKTGEVEIDIEGPLEVSAFLEKVGIPVRKARVVLLNHKKAYLDSVVRPGDRVAVFPPELAFNMYVALELAHSGRTEEEVATASARQGSHDDPDPTE